MTDKIILYYTRITRHRERERQTDRPKSCVETNSKPVDKEYLELSTQLTITRTVPSF